MSGTGTRVLFVDCAPFSGGAQRSFLGMVRALRAEGVEPFVASADHTVDGVVESCRQGNLRHCGLRARHWSRSPLGLCQFLVDRHAVGRRLRQVAAEWQPEILHANTVRAALLVPRTLSRRCPLVVHDRDVRAPGLARRLVANRARRILAISGAVAGCWPDGCELVPNGLVVAEIAQAIPAVEYTGQVAMVADFVPWKRHDLFLQAFAHLRDHHAEAKAVLIGRARDGAEDWLEQMRTLACNLDLGERVTFLTDVTCAWPHIAACRALASCALEEPFGRTVVEALALGKPVVAVRGAGPEEILQDTAAGVLVEATARAVADGLLKVWNWAADPDCAQAARRRANDFSVARMVQRVRNVYRTVQEESSAP